MGKMLRRDGQAHTIGKCQPCKSLHWLWLLRANTRLLSDCISQRWKETQSKALREQRYKTHFWGKVFLKFVHIQQGAQSSDTPPWTRQTQTEREGAWLWDHFQNQVLTMHWFVALENRDTNVRSREVSGTWSGSKKAQVLCGSLSQWWLSMLPRSDTKEQNTAEELRFGRQASAEDIPGSGLFRIYDGAHPGWAYGHPKEETEKNKHTPQHQKGKRKHHTIHPY